MEKEDTEKEINYQMIKLLLLNLQRSGLLTTDEADEIRKKAQGKIKPIIYERWLKKRFKNYPMLLTSKRFSTSPYLISHISETCVIKVLLRLF